LAAEKRTGKGNFGIHLETVTLPIQLPKGRVEINTLDKLK